MGTPNECTQDKHNNIHQRTKQYRITENLLRRTNHTLEWQTKIFSNNTGLETYVHQPHKRHKEQMAAVKTHSNHIPLD